MKNKLLLLSCLLTSIAAASDPNPPCHRLMTEKECSEHLSKLAVLRPGVALDRYLSEYARTKKEREAACNCAHEMNAIIIGPRQRQALLQF